MTLLKLIDNCRRLQSAMQMSYLDLDPVIHLDYQEARDIYEDWDIDLWSFADGEPLVPPVPGAFWYTCYGIRTFVERIES